MKINCIVVEDEPLALEKLRDFVVKLSYLNLLSSFDNAVDAHNFLKDNKVDLIFLDIQMDEFSGIQLLESTRIESQVIFTTAYDEYALKGFELSVTDYLLKPYSFQRFIQAAEKAKKNMNSGVPFQDKKYIFVKTEYRLEKIDLSEILYIEGMRDYRRIHTIDKKIMTLHTFKDLEQQIPSNIVCRVHKSYMVSLDKIVSVERDRIKIKDVLIPVSETYKKDFMERITRAPK